MKTKIAFLTLLTTFGVILEMAAGFPVGSGMNFNPAYMTSNTKWSFSYETYFENQKMNFVVFQPFENGFAGKIGVFSDENGNGIVYSIASKRNGLSIGSDFSLSNDGTSVRLDASLGMTQELLENLIFDLRVPNAFSYIYNSGLEVHPNMKMAFDWVEKKWSASVFAGVDYPWVEGGIWSTLSLFGFQAYGYFEIGYDSTLSQVTEQKLDFILQYTLANVKLAYIYEDHTVSISGSEKTHGIRVSVEW